MTVGMMIVIGTGGATVVTTLKTPAMILVIVVQNLENDMGQLAIRGTKLETVIGKEIDLIGGMNLGSVITTGIELEILDLMNVIGNVIAT